MHCSTTEEQHCEPSTASPHNTSDSEPPHRRVYTGGNHQQQNATQASKRTMSMASPQWKSYQPPVQDPAILAFQRSASITSSLSSPLISQVSAAGLVPPTAVPLHTGATSYNNNIRETGIIEKILHSYGFIQCCDREARLFFHFSEYGGNLDDVKVGDPVEFQMSFDRRSGKPIAISVVRLDQTAPETVYENLNENKVVGTIVTAAKSGEGGDGAIDGRVSYEQSGEFFFLPFATTDSEDGKALSVGDQVNFHIVTDKNTGNIRAHKLCLMPAIGAAGTEHSVASSSAVQQHASGIEKCQGVVCSMKDNYGFIERADVVREIFFHFSEYRGNDINNLVLGDDVQFAVHYRNGKEVAVNMEKLPPGTVIFEDVGMEQRRGRITNTLRNAQSRRQSEPLSGKITYETLKGPIEIPFGDKDQQGEYTLQVSDFVQFNIATDRRDRLQRATNIQLLDDTFTVNMEKRETGVVATVKDGFGFIRCAQQDSRMFFHFSEMLQMDREIRKGDELEFTINQDPSAPERQIALRIKRLPKGTVSFDSVVPVKCLGTIEKETSSTKTSGKGKDADPGIIMYDVNGTKQTIPYSAKAVIGTPPEYADKVEFQISESRKNNTKTAVNVRVAGGGANKQAGFIATLKDGFGFIEAADHEREIFFRFSAFLGEPTDLRLGDEVDFTYTRKLAKVSAENIRKLPKGTVSPEEVQPGVLDGKIIRCLRIVNPDQDEYPGLVKVITTDDDGANDVYTYGITSMSDKRDFLQKGDVVKFQIAVVTATGQKRATNISAIRKYVTATVDSIKDQYGFLSYEVEPGKKLFFHMTEVHDSSELHVGDEVQFVVMQNQRNSKYSACNLRKTVERKRPERLISRLKSVGDDNGPRVVATRQPRGPNGNGFHLARTAPPIVLVSATPDVPPELASESVPDVTPESSSDVTGELADSADVTDAAVEDGATDN